MPIPDYGALPLAKSFLYVRGLSLVAMVGIVGLTANFVSEIVSTSVSPPKEIVATLSIASIAALYCLGSFPFFYAGANLGLFIMTGIDVALLLAFIVISVVVGKPLSFLNCAALSKGSSTEDADGTAAWLESLVESIKAGGTVGLDSWAGSTRTNCYETKAIWGLCIALCILFTCSCVLLPTLWFKAKRAGLIRIKDAA